jgi:hypothetical protein
MATKNVAAKIVLDDGTGYTREFRASLDASILDLYEILEDFVDDESHLKHVMSLTITDY